MIQRIDYQSKINRFQIPRVFRYRLKIQDRRGQRHLIDVNLYIYLPVSFTENLAPITLISQIALCHQ